MVFVRASCAQNCVDPSLVVIPPAATDRLAVSRFLSDDPTHRDYLRIPADAPSCGAFPPGPAPKEGDWFTRLRETWGELKLTVPPPVKVAEPPPLAEWMKGKTILTVSQDGKAQFKTIQAALDALKPGQVVKVLDKGPYRECLRHENLQPGCGLVSEAGAVIVLPDAESSWLHLPQLMCTVGHYLKLSGEFRFSGLDFHCPAREGGYGVNVFVRDGLVLEACRFRKPPSNNVHGRPLHLSLQTNPMSIRPAVIRECWFEGRVGIDSHAVLAAPVVAVRNVFAFPANEPHLFLQVNGPFAHVTVRHNIFTAPNLSYVSLWNLGANASVTVSENTFETPTGLGLHEVAPGEGLRVAHNLFAWQGGLVTTGNVAAASIRSWRVERNTYGSLLRDSLPPTATDRVAEFKFLSDSKTDPNYLRIPLGSFGGALPPARRRKRATGSPDSVTDGLTRPR